MNEVSRAAKLLGRRGGLKGGPARASALTTKRRVQIARRAVRARWEERLPKALWNLFWEYAASEMRVAKSRPTIFLKVLTRGSKAQKEWLVERFGPQTIRDWMVERQGRGLRASTMREWGVSEAQIARMRRANPALDMWDRR
jgi:hypothetical protein